MKVKSEADDISVRLYDARMKTDTCPFCERKGCKVHRAGKRSLFDQGCYSKRLRRNVKNTTFLFTVHRCPDCAKFFNCAEYTKRILWHSPYSLGASVSVLEYRKDGFTVEEIRDKCFKQHGILLPLSTIHDWITRY